MAESGANLTLVVFVNDKGSMKHFRYFLSDDIKFGRQSNLDDLFMDRGTEDKKTRSCKQLLPSPLINDYSDVKI